MPLEAEFTAALRGTIEAARELLNDSMEAAMLRSRFRTLFTDEELAEAKQRLEDLGMDTATIG